MNRFLKHILLLFALFFAQFNASLFCQSEYENQLIHAVQQEKNSKKKFARTLILGDYYKINNIGKADSIKHVILQNSRNFDDAIRLSALVFSANINELQSKQDEYYMDVFSCIPFVKKVKDPHLSFKVYCHLSKYYSNSNDFNNEILTIEKASFIAKKMRNYAYIAEVKNLYAQAYMLENKKDSALYYSDQAIQYARRSSKKNVLAESFNIQASIYSFFGQIELSVAKNFIALQIASEINDFYKVAKYNRIIGIAQRSINNRNDAEYYFKQALLFAQKINDKHQMGLCLTSIATIHLDKKEFSEALKTSKQAVSMLTKQNDINGLAEAYNNLGLIYRELKEYSFAAKQFNQALIFYETTGNKSKIGDVYHNVATVFEYQGKYKNALNYFNRSIQIRRNYGSRNLIFTTYREISNVYAALGNQREAYKYIRLYIQQLDSNSTIQSATKIAELSELYQADQRERLITAQANAIEKQRNERVLTAATLENSELRNNFQRYVIIGFLIIIILAGIIGFYRWNQTKIKQQQKEAEMSQTLLRTQMNPHFVFNAMSVIQSYIYENDTENSSKFLVNFSRLMRLILENSPKEFIPLETEIEILNKYLETQKLRFEDRFDYNIKVSEELGLQTTLIPPMITQPFIENAIEHGQLHTIEGGKIEIVFSKNKSMLHIVIIDNGIGRSGAEKFKKNKQHKSMAMKITRDRIDNLNKKYKTDGFLHIEDLNKNSKSGTKLLISLPFTEIKPPFIQ
ncbi:MAG: histidine kinase [Crocinitomicaceae bacterium]|nr:histidine kinase [Crocinitomicaceae bacterium]